MLWLTALFIALLLLSSAGFVWNEREQALDMAEAAAARRARSLAQDLELSLALAQRAIEMGETSLHAQNPAAHARWIEQRDELLAVLTLPFALRAEDDTGPAPAGSAIGHWQAGMPTEGPQGVLPLDWRVAGRPGVAEHTHRAELSASALLRRMELGRALPRGGTALFRLDADGQLTVLARAPFKRGQAGTRIGGWLAQTLTTQESGVFATPGELDGIPRRTAFQRLAAPADRLVVAYGFAVDDVLAPWSVRWPWVALLSTVLSLVVGWGGWRLDRSLAQQAGNAWLLRQTLQHLDTVTNASASLAWTVDVNQKPDWLNQAWLDFTGRDMASECQAFWLDDLHPQDRERCAKVFNASFEARKPYSMEYRLLRHDGQYRWLHEQGQPRHDADGQFIGYVGSCLDVTDLREAETSASERGAMLKQVFDVLKDMLFVVDEQECFVFFQAGSEDRLYRKPGEFLGRPMGEVMPAELVPRLRAAMQRAREAGVQEIDYSLELPVGTRFFNARLAWLPGEAQCLFLVRDTTEQQHDQRERERLSRFVLLLFRLASRFINLPVQQMDAAIDEALRDMGEYLHVDRTYLFTYDHPAGTSTNTHEWCANGIEPQMPLYQNAPVAPLSDWYQQHRNGQKVQVADTRALPEGSLRKLLERMEVRSVLTLPLMDADTCLGFVGLDVVHQAREYGQEETTLLELFAQMLVNLQLRARAAAQVSEMTERLEQKVADRTQQLHESVQRLQTANQELESFNYSTSHDLRTPLRGIEGFSTLLLEEHAQQLDEQGKEYLQRIQRATRHMSQLVSDLLAYSRLQQLTEQVEAVAIAPCVHTVLQPFQDEIAARQGKVEVIVPETLSARANLQGLSIVLRNLIDNALKFTPSGDAPQLRISAQAEGARVRLSVSDRGMGFDMQHHDRIFGMFQRLHRQDQIPGTGIGLALVKKAVERMGGSVQGHSAPGQGATFTVELPAD